MSLTKLTWTPRSLMTHVGRRSLPSIVVKHPESGREFIAYDTWSLFPDADPGWKRPLSEITGAVAHHDAVVFSDQDANFDGHRSDEELARLAVIWRYHRYEMDWNGIGYHAVGGLEDRIYLPRQDVLETHRAHTSTSAAAGTRIFPAPGAPVWNRQLLGYCEMGNYSDRRGVDGRVVPAQDDRWTPTGFEAMDAFLHLCADVLDTTLTLGPHKRYQVKECCGDFATVDSWSDVLYRPREVRQVEVTFRRKYDVRAGDTLAGIGLRYGVTVAELVAWNGLPNPDRIEVGQDIYVEAPKVQEPAPAAPQVPSTPTGGVDTRAISEAASLALSGLDVAKKQLEDIARKTAA